MGYYFHSIALQDYQSSPPLPGAGLCAGVLLAMEQDEEWGFAYELIKVSCKELNCACPSTYCCINTFVEQDEERALRTSSSREAARSSVLA